MRVATDERLSESLHTGSLACGLRLFCLPKPGFRQKTALLAIDFGSLDDRLPGADGAGVERIPPGAAHFLEHRLFEKPGGDIADLFNGLGADADADTSYTATSFSVSSAEHFEACLDLLMRLAFEAYLPEEGIERERRVIAREIELSQDNLDWVSYFGAVGSVFPHGLLGVDIAGTLTSVAEIDADVLARCHAAFYRPDNVCLFVCGDVNPGRVLEQVERSAAALRLPEARLRPSARRPAPALAAPVDVVEVLPVVQPHLLLAFRDRSPAGNAEDLLRRELAMELVLDALFGPSSRFYDERYRQGIIDVASFSYEVVAEPGFGFCLIGGETPHAAHLEEAIIAELARARRQGIERRDFERSLRKSYGHLVQAFDQVERTAQILHGAVSCGASPFGYLAVHDRLRLDDLVETMETCLTERQYGRCRIEPEEEGEGGCRAAPAMP